MDDSRAENLARTFEIIRDPTYVGGLTRSFVVDFARLHEDQRYDADRFDPKYHEFFDRLDKADRTERLGNLLREKPKRGVQPTYNANGDILVINSQQIHADKIDTETCSYTISELVASKRNRGNNPEVRCTFEFHWLYNHWALSGVVRRN